jgi:serine/threonine protein kinase
MSDIIGKDYKLGRKLGSGAFGDVFLVVNIKNQTEYAVKR